MTTDSGPGSPGWPFEQRDDGLLYTSSGQPVWCCWFLWCDRPASHVVEHPLLGPVTCCDQHPSGENA